MAASTVLGLTVFAVTVQQVTTKFSIDLGPVWESVETEWAKPRSSVTSLCRGACISETGKFYRNAENHFLEELEFFFSHIRTEYIMTWSQVISYHWRIFCGNQTAPSPQTNVYMYTYTSISYVGGILIKSKPFWSMYPFIHTTTLPWRFPVEAERSPETASYWQGHTVNLWGKKTRTNVLDTQLNCISPGPHVPCSHQVTSNIVGIRVFYYLRRNRFRKSMYFLHIAFAMCIGLLKLIM
jgi:hypothetical protein